MSCEFTICGNLWISAAFISPHCSSVGDACCEWVCDKWEDEAGAGAVSDLGLRLMASAITAIFSLSLLFFLIYRLRQRRLRGRQNHLEAEGYGPDADLAEEAAACPGPGLQLDTMKPGDRVMLRRPFPPSYSEAMYGVQQADNLGTVPSSSSSTRKENCL